MAVFLPGSFSIVGFSSFILLTWPQEFQPSSVFQTSFVVFQYLIHKIARNISKQVIVNKASFGVQIKYTC